MLLKGKVCLITGTNKGIGQAIAESFAQEGAIVYAHARATDGMEEWAQNLAEKFNTKVVPIYFDVIDLANAKSKVLEIKSAEKKIDVLVNNAGMVTYELLPMVQMEIFKKMWEVNVVGTLNLLQIVSRIMGRQQGGSIINMASMVGEKGVKGQVSYATTKGAVIAMTKSAAKELASANIRVNAIAPGMVGTARFKGVFENSFKDKIHTVGMGRLAEPNEIATVCVFLASEMSTYVTGQIIGVDGSTSF
jgi:3-oxoacyl-[acyl-carrier protein] reductase